MAKLAFRKQDGILQALSAADPKLSLLIDKVGDYSLILRTDYFPSLVRSIIGQQLGLGAAGTIWRRTVERCKEVCPEVIINLADEDLRSAGVSGTKISYIKDLSQKVLSGEIVFETFPALPDDEIINRLTKVKGIGNWTAEMFLIFSLGRLDILSLNDLGLKRAIKWLYGLKNSPAERTMKVLGKKWAPYRTIASLYLWEVINQGFIKESPGILNG